MKPRPRPDLTFTSADATFQFAQDYEAVIPLPRLSFASSTISNYPDTPNTPYLDGNQGSLSDPSLIPENVLLGYGRVYPGPINE